MVANPHSLPAQIPPKSHSRSSALRSRSGLFQCLRSRIFACPVTLAIALWAAMFGAAQAQSLDTPSHVSLTRADGAITASWPAVAGATKYHVTYSTDGGASWHAPVDDHWNVPTNSLTFTADNATSYTVGVRAGNDSGSWSG